MRDLSFQHIDFAACQIFDKIKQGITRLPKVKEIMEIYSICALSCSTVVHKLHYIDIHPAGYGVSPADVKGNPIVGRPRHVTIMV